MPLTLANPESAGFRYFILGWNVLIGFGTSFCTDIPSPLQARFVGESKACNETSGSGILTAHCFNFTEYQYNSFYVSYAWANAVFTVIGGVISDRLGCHRAILLWCFIHVMGSLFFAIGSLTVFSATVQLMLMLGGRALLGIANGSIQTNQSQFNSFWFQAHALSFAFGIKVFVARLGSTGNFFLTDNIAEKFGLSMTLFFGVILSVSGFFCALIVSRMHMYGLRELGVVEDIMLANKRFRLKHLKKFGISFYMLTAMLAFFFCGIFAFVSDSTNFFETRYNLSETTSSYVTSIVYVFAACTPFVGLLVDKFGQRGIWMASSCGMMFLSYILIASVKSYPPWIFVCCLGLAYATFAANIWASIPLLVPFELTGSAFGIAGTAQMLVVGIANLIIGAILDTKEDFDEWQNFLYLLLVTSGCSFVLSLGVLITDYKHGKKLSPNQKQLQEAIINGDFGFGEDFSSSVGYVEIGNDEPDFPRLNSNASFSSSNRRGRFTYQQDASHDIDHFMEAPLLKAYEAVHSDVRT